MPIFSPCLSVVTIHDMMFVRYPKSYDPDYLKFASLFFPLSARRADKIITISEFSKKDIVRYCRVAEEKVEVVYLGVEPEFFHVDANTANAFVSSRYGLGQKPYVFFAGEFGPRKNLENLIRAIAQLKLMPRCKEIELVLVGERRTTGYLSHLEILIKELGLVGDVRWLDFVPRSHLRYLLKSARVSVYVSLCEGFGLPIIEAMASGTPVVCSNGSSMAEIAGNAAVIVDPREVGHIANAIFNLLTQPNLVAEYIERGKRRALQFTWENTAVKTIEVYKSLFRSHVKKL
jgi:glycosyltransferase involved in cell wall biosynthesis